MEELSFENLKMLKDEDRENTKPFMIACRDREVITEERWVLASLSTDEIKQLYEYIGKLI